MEDLKETIEDLKKGPINYIFKDTIPVDENPFVTDKEKEAYKQKIIEETKKLVDLKRKNI